MVKAVQVELEELIEQRNWGRLRERLGDWEVPEIAEVLHTLDKRQRVLLFRSLPRGLSAEVFSYFEPEDQDILMRELTDAETRHILANLDPDDRTALLEELPAEVTTRLYGLLDTEDLKEARWLLGYPEESVGRLMTPDYVAVSPRWSIQRALEHIRAQGKDSETINRIFITDPSGKLLDDVMLRRLILANPDQGVSQVMDHSFVSLSAFDDREKAVEVMRRYDIVAVPVVDSEGVLIGIVTFDDVWDVAEEEVTEDIHKAAAMEPLEMSYHRASVWDLYTRRIGWLVILVVLSVVSSVVISAFEDKLAAVITLAAFIPILLGAAGNTGSQSATLTIRALVTGDLLPSQWAGSVVKELGVGILLGVSLGVLGGCLGFVMAGARNVGLKIGLVVGTSMSAVILFANIVGVVLPFILNKARLDPAVASSPLITTIADALGLLVYFSIASAVLQL